MKIKEIKVNEKESKYSIIIGDKSIQLISSKIKKVCPDTKKICLVVDRNIPSKFRNILVKQLKKYDLHVVVLNPNEKLKSFQNVSKLSEKLLSLNFNRSDLIISFGGGVIGDFSGFVSSILKRGINFINIPSTLLAQVDAAVGGKTGVNSKFGKNLLGSFYLPKIVIIDVSLIKSLSRRELITGYAEILKHAIIFSKKFYNWLEKNSNKLLIEKNTNYLQYAIHKSCKIKLFFVGGDLKEKNKRMNLNFGHTFAHAIESTNNYSSRIKHGEAVLIGMVMATKLSKMVKITSDKTLQNILSLYKKYNLNYDLKKYFKKNKYNKIISFMSSDKKNKGQKINFVLLKRIGKTAKPGNFNYSVKFIKKNFLSLI